MVLAFFVGLLSASSGPARGAIVATDPQTDSETLAQTVDGAVPTSPYQDKLGGVEDHAVLLSERTKTGLTRELSKFFIEKGIRVFLRTSEPDKLTAYRAAAVALLSGSDDKIAVLVFTRDSTRYLYAFSDGAVTSLGEQNVKSVITAMNKAFVAAAALPENGVIAAVVAFVRNIVKFSSAQSAASAPETNEGEAPASPGVTPTPEPTPENGGAPNTTEPHAEYPLFPLSANKKPQASPSAADNAVADGSGQKITSPAQVVASPSPASRRRVGPPRELIIGGALAVGFLALAFYFFKMMANRRRSPLKLRADAMIEPAMPVYDKIPKYRKNHPKRTMKSAMATNGSGGTDVDIPVEPRQSPRAKMQSAEQKLNPPDSALSDAPSPVGEPAEANLAPERPTPHPVPEIEARIAQIEAVVQGLRTAPAEALPKLLTGVEIMALGLRKDLTTPPELFDTSDYTR